MGDTSVPFSGGGGDGKLLTQALKMTCPVCNGTFFEVGEDCIDAATLQPYESGYDDGGGDVILFKCQCGAEFGVLKTTFETAQPG